MKNDYIRLHLDLSNLRFEYMRHTWRLNNWIEETKDEDLKQLCEMENRIFKKIIKDIDKVLKKD